MTEEEWLSTSDHLRLLQAVDQTGTSQRKGILFVVSVHYQSVESIRDPSQDRMIDGLELYADSTIDREKLDQIFLEEAVHDGASLSHFTKAADAIFAYGETDEERAATLHLIREIFGNPFRPVAFAPDWRTSTAAALAQAIYDSRAFDRMPILADALEEAGCDNPEVLAHCRGDGPHVRGCWVVDLVLGKE